MSFNSDMTNLANAIRTKAGVTGGLTVSAMTTAVNGIVINPPGGGDIDFTGVNVTADKMLSGIVALDASGEKVTGNIVTVTPSVSANVFTVSRGYVAQDAELTVMEAAALSVSGNIVTVPVGYIKTERTATIPEAAVTETDSSVTIGVGYVSEELTYDLGSDIDFTGVNVTADQLLFGAVAIKADGEKVEGNIGTVRIVQEADKIVVPPGYYPEGDSFPLPDTSELTATAGSLLPGLTAIGKNGEYITGTMPIVSPYISGHQVIVPEGYHGRQMYFDLNSDTGGAFDLAKVTEYIPYAPALSAVSQIVVSGFGDDYSGANGTYNVTAETQAEADIWKRIYKHTSGEWFIWGDYDEDMEEGYWYIGVASDSGDMVTYTTEELSDGEYGFENWDTGDNYDVTLDVTKTDYPERPLVLKGVKAAGYTDGEWSFADSEQNFTGFETTPKKSYIYAVSGNKLIGRDIDYGDLIPDDAIFYAPLAEVTTTAETGQPISVAEGTPTADNGAVSFPRGAYMQCSTPLLVGATEFTIFFVARTVTGRDAHLIKDTYANDYWRICIIDRYNGDNCLSAHIRNSATGKTGSRIQIDGNKALTPDVESAIALVYSDAEIVLYADGERIGSAVGGPALLDESSTLNFGSTYNSEKAVTMRQLRIFDRALSDDEVKALTE